MNKIDSHQMDNPIDKIVVVPPIVKKTEALEFTDPEIPGEIKVDAQGRLLKTYFEMEGVLGSHIEVFDNWVINVIKKQLASRTFRIPRGEVIATNPTFFHPRIATSDNSWVPLTPQMARDNGYTYSSELYVDLILNRGTPQEEKITTFLGRFPVMLGSVLCHLRGKTEREKIEMGECPKDPLGYFIIKGAERIILIQEKLRVNRIFIFNSTSKGDVVCKMTCNTILGSSNVTIFKGKKNNALEIHLPFMGRSEGQTGKIGNTVTVFQIYRMLGVKDPNQILQMISVYQEGISEENLGSTSAYLCRVR
jgi:DNA-directed RNA polymerase beta subunit